AQVAEPKRFAGFLVVVLLAIQGPIPDKSTRAGKLKEQLCLLGSRVKAIAIGCLNRSLHGSILSESPFYDKGFTASGSYIVGLKPRKRVKPFYPRAEAP